MGLCVLVHLRGKESGLYLIVLVSSYRGRRRVMSMCEMCEAVGDNGITGNVIIQ